MEKSTGTGNVTNNAIDGLLMLNTKRSDDEGSDVDSSEKSNATEECTNVTSTFKRTFPEQV